MSSERVAFLEATFLYIVDIKLKKMYDFLNLFSLSCNVTLTVKKCNAEVKKT